MLSKIFITGKSFGETCKYVCQDLARAEVLAVEGVRGHDHRLMEKDFELQHQFMPGKEKPVFHGMLSFPPGEDPGDDKMVEIARKYLEEIRMTDTQYAIVKHTDKTHLHLHVLANRVNNEGKPIGEGLIVERGIKAARKLTREYMLRTEEGKNLKLTSLDSMRSDDAKRYRLYQAIRDALPGCRQVEDLEKRLLEKGITTRYKNDPVGGERCGISFRIENHSFKGSQVDKEYSFRNLERTLAMQREQLEKLEQRQRLEQQERLGQQQRLENQGPEKKISQGLKKEASEELENEIVQKETRELRHSQRRGHHL